MRWRVAICVTTLGCGRIGMDPLDAFVPPCVRDEFDVLDEATWIADSGGSPHEVSVENGELVVKLVGGIPDASYAGIVHREPVDFTDATLVVAVSEFVDQSGFVSDGIVVYTFDAFHTDRMTIGTGAGGLAARALVGGLETTEIHAFDPMARLWRIRHDSATGTMEAATSSDGATWQVRMSHPYPAPTTAMGILIQAGTFLGGMNQAPGRFRVSSVEMSAPTCR